MWQDISTAPTGRFILASAVSRTGETETNALWRLVDGRWAGRNGKLIFAKPTRWRELTALEKRSLVLQWCDPLLRDLQRLEVDHPIIDALEGLSQ